MTRADELMREAHGLAEAIRHERAIPARRAGAATGALAAMEARLAALWTDIRTARVTVAGVAREPVQPGGRRSRAKWD